MFQWGDYLWVIGSAAAVLLTVLLILAGWLGWKKRRAARERQALMARLHALPWEESKTVAYGLTDLGRQLAITEKQQHPAPR